MDEQMSRCKVCGATFEAGVDICPVCGANSDHFERVKAKEPFRRDSKDVYLLLGGGVAAVSAAEAIRARDATGSIAILGDEAIAPYNRPMLTKQLVTHGPAVPVKKGIWYEEKRIELLTGRHVRALHLEEKAVELDGGEKLRYDKCIYAMGAECFVPPIPGADGENCTCIRRLSDVEKLEQMVKTARSAAVIGGGVLGLEAAWAFRQLGLEVAVIEAEERLMPRQLEEGVSARLKAAAEEKGVRVFVGVKTRRIERNRVELENGGAMPAEIVVLSCGIKPNVEIAREAGLSVARAVVVDEQMRTSDGNVFACGDCAEYQGVDMGLWPEATEQGRIAGANAAGDHLIYRPQRYPVSFMGFGLRLFDGQIK